jgi:hypothetical protein
MKKRTDLGDPVLFFSLNPPFANQACGEAQTYGEAQITYTVIDLSEVSLFLKPAAQPGPAVKPNFSTGRFWNTAIFAGVFVVVL